MSVSYAVNAARADQVDLALDRLVRLARSYADDCILPDRALWYRTSMELDSVRSTVRRMMTEKQRKITT